MYHFNVVYFLRIFQDSGYFKNKIFNFVSDFFYNCVHECASKEINENIFSKKDNSEENLINLRKNN